MFGSGSGTTSTGPATANPGALKTDAEFFAYDLDFNVGATVAVGDLYHTGYADVVTGASAGNPLVKVYRGKDIAMGVFDSANPDASLVTQFFAYPTQANIGVNVAAASTSFGLNNTIITGATIGAPLVERFAPNGNPATPDGGGSFYAYDPSLNIGVNVAVADFENNGNFDILTGANAGAPHYRLVHWYAIGVMPPALNSIDAIPPDFQGGVSVGA